MKRVNGNEIRGIEEDKKESEIDDDLKSGRETEVGGRERKVNSYTN